VQRKKALAENSKANAPGATGEVADDDDGSLKTLSDEDSDGEASCDEDQEVSEGEVSEDDDARSEDYRTDEDEDELGVKPPRKKVNVKK